MSRFTAPNTAALDIDLLLQDTWLQAIDLQQHIEFSEGSGKLFWQRCVDNITRHRQALLAAGLSEQNCQHIIYAECALLDEAVKRRDMQDDAYFVWCHSPLEAHFFNTLDAGNQFYQQLETVLQQPTPERHVLTCFHRVLMLGFVGKYGVQNLAERQPLIEQLSAQITPFNFTPSQPVLAMPKSASRLQRWLRRWPLRLALATMLVAALWLSLNYWLADLAAPLLLEPIP
ncbi:type VI secretion system protein TssL, short form [Serratia microhaemolytica]|uniref:type VI secretion system protein TssL, short form n=1 Tax=Serratia microhaemolytica TaxID=2675110 RepID=UPI000FDEFBBC|nr:type VI secretion system protein TssL, short form [Serratia microhaemolytica]